MLPKNDLEVISNNIANSATTGFKRSRTEFQDIYATSEFGVSSNAIGQGVCAIQRDSAIYGW